MPYHIKTPSVLNPAIGDVYYKENDTWTETYADRKVYENESDANARKNTVVTRTLGDKTMTYTPKHWDPNATVVSE